MNEHNSIKSHIDSYNFDDISINMHKTPDTTTNNDLLREMIVKNSVKL